MWVIYNLHYSVAVKMPWAPYGHHKAMSQFNPI